MEWVILYIVCVMIGGVLMGISAATSEDHIGDRRTETWVYITVFFPPLSIAIGAIIVSLNLATRAKRSK